MEFGMSREILEARDAMTRFEQAQKQKQERELAQEMEQQERDLQLLELQHAQKQAQEERELDMELNSFDKIFTGTCPVLPPVQSAGQVRHLITQLKELKGRCKTEESNAKYQLIFAKGAQYLSYLSELENNRAGWGVPKAYSEKDEDTDGEQPQLPPPPKPEVKKKVEGSPAEAGETPKKPEEQRAQHPAAPKQEQENDDGRPPDQTGETPPRAAEPTLRKPEDEHKGRSTGETQERVRVVVTTDEDDEDYDVDFYPEQEGRGEARRANNQGVKEVTFFGAGAALGYAFVQTGASAVLNLLAKAQVMKLFWNDPRPVINSTFINHILGRPAGVDLVQGTHIPAWWGYFQDQFGYWCVQRYHDFTALSDLGYKIFSRDYRFDLDAHTPYYDMAGMGAEAFLNISVAGAGLIAMRQKYKALGASLLGFSLASHVATWAKYFFESSPDLSNPHIYSAPVYYSPYGDMPMPTNLIVGTGRPITMVHYLSQALHISEKASANVLFLGYLIAPIAAVALLARLILPKAQEEGSEVAMSPSDQLRLIAAVASSLAQSTLKLSRAMAPHLVTAFKMLTGVSIVSQSLCSILDCFETYRDMQNLDLSERLITMSICKSAISVLTTAIIAMMILGLHPLGGVLMGLTLARIVLHFLESREKLRLEERRQVEVEQPA